MMASDVRQWQTIEQKGTITRGRGPASASCHAKTAVLYLMQRRGATREWPET